jgi:hypothetical protein
MPATQANPVFTDTPIAKPVAITATANTSRTTFTTGTDLYTTAGAGFLLYGIDLVATATTTAGVIRIWLHDGTSYFMIGEVLVTAITPSTSVAVWSSRWTPPGRVYRIPPGYKIAVTTHNAESFNAVVDGEGYSV